MPQYGNITDPSQPILKEVDRIIKTGFDFVEFSIEGPQSTPEQLIAQKNDLLDRLHDRDKFAIAHMAWWAELASSYDDVRKAWIRQVKEAVQTAAILKMRKINAHSHVRGLFLQHKTARSETLQKMIESLREIVDFAEERGIEFMLENSASRRDIAKFTDFKQVLDAVPGLGVHVDVAHAYLHGGLAHIDQFLRGFKERISHIHLSDNFGKDDDHLPIGQGKINFERVVKTLKRIKYDGTITFEIFQKKSDGLPRSLATFKRLWEKI